MRRECQISCENALIYRAMSWQQTQHHCKVPTSNVSAPDHLHKELLSHVTIQKLCCRNAIHPTVVTGRQAGEFHLPVLCPSPSQAEASLPEARPIFRLMVPALSRYRLAEAAKGVD
jgi:hypothetical protein